MYPSPQKKTVTLIAKLCNILQNDLGIQPILENTHGRGVCRDDGSFGPILVTKFLHHQEHLKIIKKRDLGNNVCVSDDLIWKHCQKKTPMKSIMKDTFEHRKRPRFNHGNLYIDGECC